MASYFDDQPSSKATAEVLDLPDGDVVGKTAILSPQVTRILDDLGDDHSSSESEDSTSNSDHSEKQKKNKPEKHTEAAQHKQKQPRTPPLSKTKQSHHSSSLRPGLGSSKDKHPHLARFHSLRSMLFSSHIEQNMSKHREAEAEAKWREEYDQRRGLTRPKTPESPPKGSPPREGFAHRLGHRLRRATSKDSPAMGSIRENDNESTASSDDEGGHDFEMGKKHDEKLVSDDESINHSDVEDLVRWVSRRDPPSDGETSKKQGNINPKVEDVKQQANDSGHESLGHSDVEDLVRYVSRKGDKSADDEAQLPDDYSEASTASDSEGNPNQREGTFSNDISDADTDELVRWVSRREGPNSGPQKQKKLRKGDNHAESHSSELARWITKTDDTSGESDVGDIGLATEMNPDPNLLKPQDAALNQASKQRESFGLSSGRPPLKETLTHDDVDDLVRWVSRRHDSGNIDDDYATNSDVPSTAVHQKKDEVGRSRDKGSLDHDDVNELIQWVSRKQ